MNRVDKEELTMNGKHFSAKLKVLPVMLAALVIAVTALPMAVAHADAPTPVSGTRAGTGPPRNVVRTVVGGNTIVTRENTQVWTGGISGMAEVWVTQINHPNGEFTTRVISICACIVGGATGTLYMFTQGNSDPNEELFSGTWTITGAEGGLEGLHGQGTATHVPPGAGLYEGFVHFEP
jgi:hypothetical protein